MSATMTNWKLLTLSVVICMVSSQGIKPAATTNKPSTRNAASIMSSATTKQATGNLPPAVDMSAFQNILATLQGLPMLQQQLQQMQQQKQQLEQLQQQQHQPQQHFEPNFSTGKPLFPMANAPVPSPAQNQVTTGQFGQLLSNHQPNQYFSNNNRPLFAEPLNFHVPRGTQVYHSNNHISFFEKQHLVASYGLNQEQKLKLLEEHNKYRKEVSGSVGNMNVLRWNEQLSVKAFQEVVNCSYVNQGNGAIMGMVHEKKTGSSLSSEIVGRWSNEKSRFNPHERCSYKRSCRYSQMVWADTKEMGCAVNICSDMSFMACMYNPPGNVMNKVAFVEGGFQCSSCATPPGMPIRCNTDGLCEWY